MDLKKFCTSLNWNFNTHSEIYHNQESSVTMLYNTFHKDILDTLTTSTPRARISPHSKLWWNETLSKTKQDITISCTRLKNLRECPDAESRCLNEKHIHKFHKNLFCSEVSRANRVFFNEILSNLDGVDIWKVTKWGRGNWKYALPPIK